MAKIRKGDQVKIIMGKDRGKTGKVLRVFNEEEKITVEGLNIVKKHARPRKEGEKGQRIEIPGKLNISNIMLVCPKCGKATRVGYKKSDAGKLRICKKCQSEI
jgi:large subunit ribosomal protein L24